MTTRKTALRTLIEIGAIFWIGVFLALAAVATGLLALAVNAAIYFIWTYFRL